MTKPGPTVAVSAVLPRSGPTGAIPPARVSDLELLERRLQGSSRGAVFWIGEGVLGSAHSRLGCRVFCFSDAAAALWHAVVALRKGDVDAALISGGPASGELDPSGGILLERHGNHAGEPPLAFLAGMATATLGSDSEQRQGAIQTLIDAAVAMAGLALARIGLIDLPDTPEAADCIAPVAIAAAASGSVCWAHLRPSEQGNALFVASSRSLEALRCGQIFAVGEPHLGVQPSALAIASTSMPWLRPAHGRHALVLLAEDDSATAIILSEHRVSTPAEPRSRLAEHAAALIPIAARDAGEIEHGLESLAASLAAGEPYHAAASRLRRVYAEDGNLPFAAAVIARSQADAAREATFLRRAVQSGGAHAKTPFGSVMTHAPIGRGAGIAFVYPGAGSAYPGLGEGLFALFPGLAQTVEASQSDHATWLAQASVLYPPDLARLDDDALERLESRVAQDPGAQLSASVFHALALTTLVRRLLGIQPNAAIGYCIGEVAMFAALGVWGDLEELSRRHEAMRALNKLSEAALADRWQTHVLLAPAHEVFVEVDRHPGLCVTIINTPAQVVIAGNPVACQNVVRALGCRSLRVAFNQPAHCEAIAVEREALAAVHRLPVTPDLSIAFHSQHASPLPQDSDSIADAISRMYTQRVDFPRIVRSAYDGGARVFLELGARQMCSTWIDDILGARPHLAASFDIKGADPAVAILRAAAQLVTHRIPCDLDRLFGESGNG